MKESSISILIVDDDLDLLMLLERSLLKKGFIVETAASLPEAEEILQIFKADIILLDINVNGDDGRKLCWKLKHGQENREIKIIIMSGFDVNLGRAVLFGADDLIVKPFDTEFLYYKIGQQGQKTLQ